MKYHTRFVIALTALLVVACEKEEQSSSQAVERHNMIVLNEGNWGSNNASLSVVDTDSSYIDNGWFQTANGRRLGDQAQDMIVYGSKLYVTVTESNTLEVVDPASGMSTQLRMGSLKPRYIAAHSGKLYISCYNPPCVVCVDTATLTIEDTCLLADYRPEGIAIAQGTAFVAGAYHKGDYNLFDNKIYRIDLSSFDTLPSWVVGLNNNRIEKMNENTLFVNCGNGTASSPNGAYFMDATTGDITPADFAPTKMALYNGTVYGFSAPYGDSPAFALLHADGSSEPFPFEPALTDLEQNENPYAIAIDPNNGDIYIATDGAYRVPGDIFCFKRDGQLRFRVEAGMFPSKMIFF